MTRRGSWGSESSEGRLSSSASSKATFRFPPSQPRIVRPGKPWTSVPQPWAGPHLCGPRADFQKLESRLPKALSNCFDLHKSHPQRGPRAGQHAEFVRPPGHSHALTCPARSGAGRVAQEAAGVQLAGQSPTPNVSTSGSAGPSAYLVFRVALGARRALERW